MFLDLDRNYFPFADSTASLLIAVVSSTLKDNPNTKVKHFEMLR